MNFKPIPGFEDKFEIGEDGTVRNLKTKGIRAPYRISKKHGPLVQLFDKKTNRDLRIAVIAKTFELFGKVPQGWDGYEYSTYNRSVQIRVEKTPEEKEAFKKAREKAKAVKAAEKAMKAKARAAKKIEKEMNLAIVKAQKTDAKIMKKKDRLRAMIAELQKEYDAL